MVRATTGKAGGFDFGLKTFLTDQDGTEYRMPEYFKSSLNVVRRLHQSVSRKKEGSRGWKESVHRLGLEYERMVNRRSDAHWKLARGLATEYDELYFEALNIAGMQQLWKRKVSDLGFSSYLEIQKHVARKLGAVVRQIARWEPSTQTCSECLSRHAMGLGDRVFVCPECGLVLPRDQNSARNILRVGASTLAESA